MGQPDGADPHDFLPRSDAGARALIDRLDRHERAQKRRSRAGLTTVALAAIGGMTTLVQGAFADKKESQEVAGLARQIERLEDRVLSMKDELRLMAAEVRGLWLFQVEKKPRRAVREEVEQRKTEESKQ